MREGWFKIKTENGKHSVNESCMYVAAKMKKTELNSLKYLFIIKFENIKNTQKENRAIEFRSNNNLGH